MNAEELADRLGARRSGTGWSALCPSHPDTSPSLSVAEGDNGGIVLHCHAGCRPEDVVTSIGLSMADLNGTPRIVADYPYTDLNGNVLYTIHRWVPKSFTVSPTGISPADRTLYRRDVIEWARSERLPLYVVEGEKDVEALIGLGAAATTAPHGAQSPWLPQYTDLLRGMHVTVVADNDEPGLKRGREVYAALKTECASVTLVKPMYGKDISDLIAAGYGKTGLEPVSEVPGLRILEADVLSPKKVSWAWPSYIPFGSLCLVDGDPGSAKSTLTIDLVARWSTGMRLPDGSGNPGPLVSIMVSAEDDPEATIVPRLDAAGANRKRVKLVAAGIRDDLPFNLGVDFDALNAAITHYEAKILVLDPLSAFLPTGTDTKMDSEVRKALGPLAHMARQRDIAVIVVRHLTKSATSAMYAGSGSVGFIAAARAAFMVTHDPTRSKQHRVFACIKQNLSPMPESLSYTVEPSTVNPEVAHILWHGEVGWDAQQLMDHKRGLRTEDDTELQADAKEYLRHIVSRAEAEGLVGLSWDDILRHAKEDHIDASPRTLERARKGVLKRIAFPTFQGERLNGWFWQVIPTSPTSPTFLNGSEPEPFKKVGEVGEVTEASETLIPGTEDWLDAQPFVCDIEGCQSGEHVRKWGAPWFVVRCDAHNPRTFDG